MRNITSKASVSSSVMLVIVLVMFLVLSTFVATAQEATSTDSVLSATQSNYDTWVWRYLTIQHLITEQPSAVVPVLQQDIDTWIWSYLTSQHQAGELLLSSTASVSQHEAATWIAKTNFWHKSAVSVSQHEAATWIAKTNFWRSLQQMAR